MDLSPLFYKWNSVLEKSIVNDFFNPVTASRVYVYPNLALNQVLNYENEYQINLNGLPGADSITNREMASLFAFYYTSRKLVFDSNQLDENYKNYKTELEKLGYSNEEISTADSAGLNYSKKILFWAGSDLYAEMRTYPKYELKNKKGTWMPTPPDYLDALEPHWGKIRPLTLDSSSQFRATEPPEFSEIKSKDFYKETQLVFEESKKGSLDKYTISTYWDCNPLVLKHDGHLTYSDKKLTPGGHWLNIGLQVCKSKNFTIQQSAYVNAILSISIFDSFISCWETKYFYNYIRPVTAINNNLDPNWLPYLTTPNFPEYTSGHSVISSSSAFILSTLFGDQVSFVDSSEVNYGNAPREYKSFNEARDEAAISRFYAGIHFMPAINNGKKQGEQIGVFIKKKLNLKLLSK